MDKQKLINLLLVTAAILMLTAFAFAVRPVAPATDGSLRKAGGCCCPLTDRNNQKP